ncbi:hypothetical protein D8674_021726 [Pyrus ussuriensis x Pyrus communis]|uniref:RNase H type-1 domain-containing protein n=1 Tax=Pyrus ussuriensis x Pyrus communis TaxID=2448454 RepID=A0A5N5GIE7_9ROSA|nr:hypothetical protein D8674_021726 [Pyrus ussuriensis x Pyrus communis]
MEFVLDNRPWYVKGQIFHLEKWTTFFRDMETISTLRVWVRIPRLSVQYRDAEILEVIMQPVGTFIREVCPVLLSYEKLFEVCFYYGRRRLEGHKCPALEDNDGWLLVDIMFEDKPLVYPTGAEISEETKHELHGGVMLVFPQPMVGEKVNTKDEEELELRDQARSYMRMLVKVGQQWLLGKVDCALVSDDIEGGDGVNVARANKGKSVVEEDEEFIEAEEENVEQIQFVERRKRGRNSEGKLVGLACSGMTKLLLLIDDEIWKAVNGIGMMKASGTDGFHAVFYQKCWDVVGPLIIRLVLVEFGMNNHWIKLIMECITSTSLSVLINDKLNKMLDKENMRFLCGKDSKMNPIAWNKMRNQVVFNKAKAYPSMVDFLATSMANEYNNVNKKNYVACRKQEGLIRWQLPRDNFFKPNFDCSVRNFVAAAGFILRNDRGEPVMAGARSLREVTINVVECIALRDALWMVRSRGLKKIMVDGDSKLVVDAV